MNALNQVMARLMATNEAVLGLSGLVTALLLLVILRVLLPPPQRSRLRLPLWALLLYGVLQLGQALAAIMSLPGSLEAPLRTGALFLMLLVLGRLGFLLFFDVLFNSRLARPIPKIILDILQGLVYVVIILLMLQAVGVQPSSLLLTSALITAVVGFSLQETLGNLLAGLALQIQRPFEVGNWIQFDNNNAHNGEVTEINWRATKIITRDRLELVIPNGMLSKSLIVNFSKPDKAMRCSVTVSASSHVPPRQVEAVLLKALADIPGIVPTPPPSIAIDTSTERGIIQYQVKYFIEAFDLWETLDQIVKERAWYAMERAGINAPLATSKLYSYPQPIPAPEVMHEQEVAHIVRALREVNFLQSLTSDELHRLAAKLKRQRYAPDEIIFRESEAADEFFILYKGTVQTSVGGRDVAQLPSGSFFGEVSILTGSPRTATVRAIDEVELYVMEPHVLRELLNTHPAVAIGVCRRLAEKQIGIEKAREAGKVVEEEVTERTNQFFEKLKELFSL